MKLYLAPMEGITGHVYRNVFNKHFPYIDKFFTPFLVTNQKLKFKKREIKDILPENNKGINLVPQIMSNNYEQSIWALNEMKNYGYKEVNLNAGCPSGTVVTKRKGSGMLKDPEFLDEFLYNVFSKMPEDMVFSVKTRIGVSEKSEIYRLMEIYNKYPISELIVHPRLQKEMYRGNADISIYKEIMDISKIKLCYNGDIFSKDEFEKIDKEIDEDKKSGNYMLGRGVIMNPSLPGKIKGEKDIDIVQLKAFMDDLLLMYSLDIKEENNVMFKMKEIWAHFKVNFPDSEKELKAIRKAKNIAEYRLATEKMYKNKCKGL